jgi:hypothetical protein
MLYKSQQLLVLVHRTDTGGVRAAEAHHTLETSGFVTPRKKVRQIAFVTEKV